MKHNLIYSGYHLWFLYDYLVNRKGWGVDVGKPPDVFPGISSKLVLDVSRNIFADKTIHCFKLFCTQCKIWRTFNIYAYIVYPFELFARIWRRGIPCPWSLYFLHETFMIMIVLYVTYCSCSLWIISSIINQIMLMLIITFQIMKWEWQLSW